MSSLVLVGEDALCCALGESLVAQVLPDWALAFAPINTGGVNKLEAAIPRYLQQAQHVQPVLCIADTDGRCPVVMKQAWLQNAPAPRFLLRLAVSESEAWALADRAAFAAAFGVSAASVPQNPEVLPDIKRTVLRLASRSTKRRVREDVPSGTDPSKPGSGYNEHLCSFARRNWRAQVARLQSPSLNRAIAALERLRAA